MSENRRKRRVSKSQWLEAALETLGSEGVTAVRIERLARKLGISKSGFYWHFRDRKDLLSQMLEYWAHEYTEVVAANQLLLDMKPKERLLATSRMIDRHRLEELDLAIRAWAKTDPEAKSAADHVTGIRLEFLRRIFDELGFDPDEAETRTHLFVCYETWEHTMFAWMSQKSRDSMRKRRLELLTRE